MERTYEFRLKVRARADLLVASSAPVRVAIATLGALTEAALATPGGQTTRKRAGSLLLRGGNDLRREVQVVAQELWGAKKIQD